jgi:hypothetical protein
MGANSSLTPSDAKQLSAANGLALVRVTIGAMFLWVFFENLGKGLYTGGLRGSDQLLPQGEPLPGCLEGGDGPVGKPRRDSGSHAGPDRDFSRYPARHRPAYPTRRNCGFSVSRQPLDFGVGHLVDMGTAGSGARIARTRDRKRRPEMGR